MLLDGQLRLFLPVNPSADGIVQRHIVFSDQGAAGRGGTQAAQADSLRRGIGHQRTRPAEHLHAGKLAQFVVQGHRSRGIREPFADSSRVVAGLSSAPSGAR